MNKIKKAIERLSRLGTQCPNGHMTVISLPDGTLVCQDCPWRSR